MRNARFERRTDRAVTADAMLASIEFLTWSEVLDERVPWCSSELDQPKMGCQFFSFVPLT
jgi:hypothetical protein